MSTIDAVSTSITPPAQTDSAASEFSGAITTAQELQQEEISPGRTEAPQLTRVE